MVAIAAMEGVGRNVVGREGGLLGDSSGLRGAGLMESGCERMGMSDMVLSMESVRQERRKLDNDSGKSSYSTRI